MTGATNQSRKDPVVRGSDAMPVGMGFQHRQYVPPNPNKSPEDPDLQDPSKPEEWLDRPSIAGQLQDPRYWKLDRVELRIFDFSDEKQLASYNELASKAVLPEANFAIVRNEQQFCTSTGSWKALVELQYVKFRKLFVKKDE
jgi:hypothetical protein